MVLSYLIDNLQLIIDNYFDLDVLTILISNFNNSIIFGLIFWNSISDRYFVSYSKSIQYSVSLVSFNEIDNLWTKSALLCACSASLTFAPMMFQNATFVLTKRILFFRRVLYKVQLLLSQIKMIFFNNILLLQFYKLSIINWLPFPISSQIYWPFWQ